MKNANERKSLSSSPSPPLDCDVGLGLKMQRPRTASYSCDGGGGGGIPFFNGSTYQQPHIYELANGVLLQRNFDSTASRASSGGMMMPVYGKGLFTSSQLQELERQKMIHKYILASIPVPPQLLMSISSTSPPPSSLISQCNTPGLDLRFPSSGSDPEPWRCKRTDGKKWRCSRDVAPDQKYCERHAHKNRPRSRKHVEISPHNKSTTTTLQRSTSQFPTMLSPTSYADQTRCIEWLMRGGNRDDTAAVSSCKQPQQHWDQEMLNRDKNDNNVSVYHPQFAEKQDFTILNPEEFRTDQTTRLFIDAWGKDGVDGMSSSAAASTTTTTTEKKLSWPSSSLSLSMSRMAEGDDEEGEFGIGILKNDHQWVNQGSWMNSSAPGGPLGEALCLGNGNSSTVRGGFYNLPSPHGNANNTNSSSSCSKSSCEDGTTHALNFVG
ncbi:hypothetical protein C2S53_004078 [Perilla frutescens var. hirtella]|uniref:Growth-regulating factor n=1 Tax=Perilla frutescens var. hirtella TaxID=608512 RepID=A0AAD4JBN6_PERFH|nr:hypothetical protein C2S53_004078 [Perilla frutescens var. hirtella]